MILLFIGSMNFSPADENSGLPANDPKEMTSVSEFESSPFLPLPAWSNFTHMPSTPDFLLPMGKNVMKVVAVTPPPKPPPPPVETPRPAPPPPEPPALVAVSPFLQWIKDHPDAAAEAHKQAAAYQAPPQPPGAAAPGTADPYWMPPLDSGGSGSITTGSSAAIYSTPQR
jgi:hypothetical protein